MEKLTIQKIVHLIESGKVHDDLRALADYVFSFLHHVNTNSKLAGFEISVSDFIDIYRTREIYLSHYDIEHGGFLETINLLEQTNMSTVSLLSVETDDYLFIFLTERELIVGILYKEIL